MSSFTKSLFRLTIVTFVCAMLMPVTTTRAGPPNAEGCHPHKGPCGDDPPVEASEYTVTLSGELTSVGDHDGWLVTTSGHRSIDFLADFPFDGNELTLDLSFFASMGAGEICFGAAGGSASVTDVYVAGITKRNIKGGIKQAVGMFWFAGFNAAEPPQPLNYLLGLFGTFDNADSWPSTQDLKMTEWEITTASGAGDAAQGACIGEGPFDNPGTQDIEEVVKIVVTAHAAND